MSDGVADKWQVQFLSATQNSIGARFELELLHELSLAYSLLVFKTSIKTNNLKTQPYMI